MKENVRKLQSFKADSLDKSNVFLEINSPSWRNPGKITLEELLGQTKATNKLEHFDITKHIDHDTLIVDSSTLKIKVNSSFLNTSNVYHETLNFSGISIHTPPKNASEVTGLHLRSDSHHLYIWTGERWKRVALLEW
jgi:hypothetical protein